MYYFYPPRLFPYQEECFFILYTKVVKVLEIAKDSATKTD